MNSWYKTEPCLDWDDFLRKVQNIQTSVYFRGHSINTQPLKSTFDRAIEASQTPVRDRWMYEAAVLREFRRRAHHFLKVTPERTELLEWLALMRHFGAPCRLVDFTYSHYIAAYFAFSSSVCETRAIWAIEKSWLIHESKTRCSQVLGVPTNMTDMHIPENFSRCFLDPAAKDDPSRLFVSPVNAERMNERLTVQQGFFLCPGDIQHSFEENLKSMVSDESCQKPIIKFTIPHNARGKALTELRHMNISRATLFPDLGGLAESLNDRFEVLFRDYDISEEVLRAVVTWWKDK